MTLTVAAGLLCWHWLVAIRHPEWAERAPMLVWFLGAGGFAWVLIGRDGAFIFLVYGLYPQVFSLLGRWAVPGVVALTLLVFARVGDITPGDPSSWLVNVGGSVILAVVVGMFVNAIARQSQQRREALDALEATRAELATTSRRAGVLAERERLARDIHDTVAQVFTGIVMQLEAAEQALDTDPGTAGAHLDRARRSARDGLGELRRSVHALRPELLEGATLAQALDHTVRRWAEETGTAAAAATTGVAVTLHPDAEVALLRAAQEALANIAKHARATRATVTLSYAGDVVALDVDDDGVGFDPAAAGNGGLGLTGMRERAAALGGRVAVESAFGRGTTVAVTLPPPRRSPRDGGRDP